MTCFLIKIKIKNSPTNFGIKSSLKDFVLKKFNKNKWYWNDFRVKGFIIFLFYLFKHHILKKIYFKFKCYSNVNKLAN